MKRVKFAIDRRTESGGGPSKKLRNNGYIPGIVYGRGIEPISIKVNDEKIREIIREYGQNCIFRLELPEEKDEIVAIIKDIQLDYLSENILHLDFFKISLEDQIVVQIPIISIGQSEGEEKGGILDQSLYELEVQALPLDVPEYIEVDVTELDFGDLIHSGELNIPENVEMITNPDILVFTVSAPSIVEIPVEEEEEVEELLEGEVVDEEEMEEEEGEEATEEETTEDE